MANMVTIITTLCSNRVSSNCFPILQGRKQKTDHVADFTEVIKHSPLCVCGLYGKNITYMRYEWIPVNTRNYSIQLLGFYFRTFHTGYKRHGENS